MAARVIFLCLILLLALSAQFSPLCPASLAGPEMIAGQAALKKSQPAEAAGHFRTATQLDSSCVNAWVYLGKAYLSQYIPGADASGNLEIASKARAAFENAVAQKPQNEDAISSIALLYFNQKDLDQAADWFNKLAIVNPGNKQAFYNLGVIAWTRSDPLRRQLRAKLGMTLNDPGPLPDSEPVRSFRDAYATIVREGIEDLEMALHIDGEYDDAMAYLNKIYIIRADTESSVEDYRADLAKADEWLQKALETKKARTPPLQ